MNHDKNRRLITDLFDPCIEMILRCMWKLKEHIGSSSWNKFLFHLQSAILLQARKFIVIRIVPRYINSYLFRHSVPESIWVTHRMFLSSKSWNPCNNASLMIISMATYHHIHCNQWFLLQPNPHKSSSTYTLIFLISTPYTLLQMILQYHSTGLKCEHP